MTQSEVYITSMGTFLPGEPIANDQMEDYLGKVHGKPSRLRKRILRSNGILSRYYAVNNRQQTTHQNSELAAHAISACLEKAPFEKRDLQMLAVATTQGDLPLPGMASIVQAALRLPPCEILTTHGVCSSGIMALKSAVNSVRLGEHENAIVCASELSSRLLKGSRYEAVDAEVDLEAEFLRWMLSDGAGAMTLQTKPRRKGISLKVDWIDIKSYASDFDLCMSCGTADQSAWTSDPAKEVSRKTQKLPHPNPMHAPLKRGLPSVSIASSSSSARSDSGRRASSIRHTEKQHTDYFPQAKSWQDYPTYAEAEAAGALLIRQNLRILDAIVRVGVEGFLRLIQAGKIAPSEIDHFVCHYSSHYFRGEILKHFQLLGCEVPEEKWFSNLYTKGNTGSAAMFIALEELFYSGKLKPGETIFCVVPESGRFCTAYMKLTVVGDA
jgi:3-oxoacyl-[acyl-carrier-protein] synthase III